MSAFIDDRLPKCPWCNHAVRDPEDYALNGDQAQVVECENCEKEFEITCRVMVSYTVQPVLEWRECKECGGEGVVPMTPGELQAVGWTEGQLPCHRCIEGKEYVTPEKRMIEELSTKYNEEHP